MTSKVSAKKKMSPMAAAMAEKRLSYSDLAALTGRSVRTLHNLAAGNNTSRGLRQVCCNVLRKSLWGIPVSEQLLVLRAGTEIEYSSPKQARESAADELRAGVASLRGRVVILEKTTAFVVASIRPKDCRQC